MGLSYACLGVSVLFTKTCLSRLDGTKTRNAYGASREPYQELYCQGAAIDKRRKFFAHQGKPDDPKELRVFNALLKTWAVILR